MPKIKPAGITYNCDSYDRFNVYLLDDKYTFFYIEIKDDIAFYEDMFDYFFSEEQLIRYIENKSCLKFEPNIINFVSLHKHLELYIDFENIEREKSEFEKDIFEIIKEEYELEENKIGNLIIRLDKIGRVGEYIFNCILAGYFKFDCIIPKVHLTTDPNMSVYGIDSLFYSSQDDLLLFGESKVTNSIDNGIGLINKSLKDYEQQIKTEYKIVLSNRFYKRLLNKFDDIYGNQAEISIDIEDFIRIAKIEKIGVPIFIAHGNETDVSLVLQKFRGIKKKQLLGLETIYYLISMPIINKSKLMTVFTEKIREKRERYEDEYKKYQSTIS